MVKYIFFNGYYSYAINYDTNCKNYNYACNCMEYKRFGIKIRYIV